MAQGGCRPPCPPALIVATTQTEVMKLLPHKILNVLIACEESQAECKAFRDLGHNAYSCDIQPCRTSGNPGWHIHHDVTPYLNGETSFKTQDGQLHTVDHWDLMICHPPCTYLSKVGSPWLHEKPTIPIDVNGVVYQLNQKRYNSMLIAREFFFACLNANAPYVAVENPIPMRLAGLPKPSFFACPSWYGVKYSKKTLYWVKNLPPLIAEIDYPNPKSFVGSSRGKYRSRTFPQLARAIARQWSEWILSQSDTPCAL